MVEQVKTKSEPRVRFRGFTDEWEEVKLGDVGKTLTGLSGKTKDDFGHGDAAYVTYSNVFQNAVSDIDMLDSVEIDPRQTSLEYGDVLFTTSSETPEEVGMSSVWLHQQSPVYLNSFCFGLRPTMTVDYYYLAVLLRSPIVRRQFVKLAQGISRYNISKKKSMNIRLPLPSLDEQQKIGELFQTLDKAIDLSNTQVESLKQQKKALLQRLFPRKGETEPKVRLRGFTDAWEEVTLGDVLNKGNKNRVDDPNDYNRLTVKLNKKGLEEFVSERELANTRPFYQRFKGEIIIGKQNYFNGSIAIVTDEFDGFVSSNAIMSFSVKNDMATTAFIYFLISQDDFIKQREHFANGTGQKELSESDFLNFKLNLPSLEEQQAIGELFQTLDEQIRLAEDKVSQYKELKQALLQRLFV